MEASDWLRTEVNVAITFVCGRTAYRINALTTPSLFLRGCLPTPCFQHGRTRWWISMHAHQTDTRTFVKIQIQRNPNRVSATLASNIASDSQMQQKLRLKRIKYISIRRGKSLPLLFQSEKETLIKVLNNK